MASFFVPPQITFNNPVNTVLFIDLLVENYVQIDKWLLDIYNENCNDPVGSNFLALIE